MADGKGWPLVVPEVNPDDVDWHNGIIANPKLLNHTDGCCAKTHT
jgi:aspartate-semialdehyde dehydrogenase